jgi:hypothetical protein
MSGVLTPNLGLGPVGLIIPILHPSQDYSGWVWIRNRRSRSTKEGPHLHSTVHMHRTRP